MPLNTSKAANFVAKIQTVGFKLHLRITTFTADFDIINSRNSVKS